MRLRLQFLTSVLACMAVTCPALCETADLAGIAHVALRVSDLQNSRSFYQKLGFEPAFEFSEAGKVTQSFIKINDRQFIELYPRTQETQAIGLMHVCYESTDIAASRELLVKRGADPSEIKKARAGNFLFVLHDPEDQVVEYTQYLPGSLHSADHGKHLGRNRLSERLASVMIPVKHGKTEQDFYSERLGFSAAKSTRGLPRLTVGGSSDSVELEETGLATTDLHFSVTNLKEAKKKLHAAGIATHQGQAAVVVRDPDGNQVVLEQTSSPAK